MLCERRPLRGCVHIFAESARTPVGLTVETTAAAIRASVSRIQEHPRLVDSTCAPLRGAYDPQLDPTLTGRPRLVELLREPLYALLRQLPAREGVNDALPILLAAPELRPGWTASDETALVERLGELNVRGVTPPTTIEVAGRGHAGALRAIELARARSEARDSGPCIVAGVDSYFDAETLGWLMEHRRIPSIETRSAMFPGEGAAALALASGSWLRQVRMPSRARIAGVATSHETARHGVIGSNNLGRGLTAALVRCLEETADPRLPVDDIYCDLNGERYRTDEWGFSILRVQSHLRDPSAYRAPADRWGDQGAASGVLLASLAIQAWARGYSAGPRALVFAGSDGGLRGAVVLEEEGRS